MNFNEETLREQYRGLSTDQLLELYTSGTLTDLANNVLEGELTTRGVAVPQRLQPITQNVKVGGWLLFFCLTLVVLIPIITISGRSSLAPISFLFDTPTLYKQYLMRYPALDTVDSIENWFILGVTAFGIYTGITLWRRRTNAISIAIAYLGIHLACSLMLIVFPFIIGMPRQILLTEIENSVPSIFYCLFWFGYLRKSRRVRETYV